MDLRLELYDTEGDRQRDVDVEIGNLDEDEAKLFDTLIYEIRMHFVNLPSDG